MVHRHTPYLVGGRSVCQNRSQEVEGLHSNSTPSLLPEGCNRGSAGMWEERVQLACSPVELLHEL